MNGDGTLDSLGEDALIARLTEAALEQRGVVVGPGDDCAVVESGVGENEHLLLKTDCLIEGVHFLAGTDPEQVGWKAMCRVLSDIAAMGGTPLHAMITLAIDGARRVSEIEGWYRGMRLAATRFGGVPIVGGETAALKEPGAIISVMMTGRVNCERVISRGGARPGDVIVVTGKLGGSFESGRHLRFCPRLEEGAWFAGLEKELRPTGMMDLSDGLAQDLPRLADRSGGLGYRVDFERLPRHEGVGLESAVGEGEDYELLVTMSQNAWEVVQVEWPFSSCDLSRIGEMHAGGERTKLDGGWDHFRRNSS